MTEQLSEVVQVPRRCPDSCQKWCRIWPTESQAQRFQGCMIWRLFARTRILHLSISHRFVHGWTSAFLLAVHRLCGVFEGRLSHFLPHWLRTGWQSAISQEQIPWNTPPWLGNEPGPRGGQTVSYPTELSWLTCIPHREGKSMGRLPLFNTGIQNRCECCKRQSFARAGNRSPVR